VGFWLATAFGQHRLVEGVVDIGRIEQHDMHRWHQRHQSRFGRIRPQDQRAGLGNGATGGGQAGRGGVEHLRLPGLDGHVVDLAIDALARKLVENRAAMRCFLADQNLVDAFAAQHLTQGAQPVCRCYRKDFGVSQFDEVPKAPGLVSRTFNRTMRGVPGGDIGCQCYGRWHFLP